MYKQPNRSLSAARFFPTRKTPRQMSAIFNTYPLTFLRCFPGKNVGTLKRATKAEEEETEIRWRQKLRARSNSGPSRFRIQGVGQEKLVLYN